MNVEIEYCVVCGHLDRAMATQRALLESFGGQVETVSLRTGDGGVFIVRVDGEQVLDASEDGYDLEAVEAEVDERLAA